MASFRFYDSSKNAFVEPHTIKVRGESGFVPTTVYVHDGSGFVPAFESSQVPYGGTVREIPGRIQAENFDTGGEGVAYHDTTSGNKGGAYRDTAVDITETQDSSGSYNIGYTEDGEWLEYTVDVTAGTYDVLLRVASDKSEAGTARLKLDGSSIATFDVSDTGGWQSWTTLRVSDVSLSSGRQILRLEFDGGDINLNWLEVTEPDTESPTAPTNLSSPDQTTNSVDLSWDASSDNQSVDYYKIYVDGSKWTESADTSETIDDLNANTAYDFFVTAVDSSGNESSESDTISVTTSDTPSVTQWGVFEIALTSEGSYTNSEKYAQVRLEATFSGPDGQNITVPGFWDGGDTFRIRFAPPVTGTWTYETSSSESSLDGHTGSVEAEAPTKSQIDSNPNYRGFLRSKTTSDSRYLAYADDTPFNYIAGTSWDGNSDQFPYDPDFQSWVDDRQSKGMTALQLLVAEASGDYVGGRHAGINEGGKLWAGTDTAPDYDEINPDNMQWFDKRIEYLHAKGVVPNIYFEWSGQYNEMTKSQLKNYYRHLVARYGSYNVIWTLSGEWNRDTNDAQLVRDLGNYVDSIDGLNHLLTIHPYPGSTTSDFGGDSWIDIHTHQSQDRNEFDMLNDDWGRTEKPLVNSEPHVANTDNFENRLNVRRDAWQILTSGLAAGMAHLYRPIAYGADRFSDVTTHLDGKQTRDVVRAYQYFENIDWQDLVSDQNLILSGQSNNDSGIKVASYLPDGSLELVYYSNNSDVKIDLTPIDTTTAELTWLRTADGTRQTEGTFDSSSAPTLSPPSGWDDALLIIEPA